MAIDAEILGYQPLAPARHRAAEVSERIAADIREGRLPPGARLPTEHELALSLGVSRTVIREAVAALKADGLVITRQGAGAFVAADSTRVPFRIVPDAMSLIDVIHVMELRLATEVEAAAFAAERGKPDQFASLASALDDIDRAIDQGSSAVLEDFAFHLTIAAASGNPMFERFLTFLGHHVIPRQHARAAQTAPDERVSYLMKIQQEHRAIVAAVTARDSLEARRAMRAHLANSLQRQRNILSIKDNASGARGTATV